MVLRPETSHTYTRCVGRIGGHRGRHRRRVGDDDDVAADGFCRGGPRGGVSRVDVCGGPDSDTSLSARRWPPLSCFCSTSTPPRRGRAMEDRLFAIVIGGGLALVAHVALPDHALTRLHQRAGELLKTEIDYAATVVKAFVHELDHPADALSAAWQRAFRARAAFEAASGATRLDSRELRRWLRSYRAALNAVTSSLHLLGGQSADAAAGRADPRIRRGGRRLRRCAARRAAQPGQAVDRRHRRAHRGQSTGARAGVQDSPRTTAPRRVLVAELATITRSLSGIVASREPTSAG